MLLQGRNLKLKPSRGHWNKLFLINLEHDTIQGFLSFAVKQEKQVHIIFKKFVASNFFSAATWKSVKPVGTSPKMKSVTFKVHEDISNTFMSFGTILFASNNLTYKLAKQLVTLSIDEQNI